MRIDPDTFGFLLTDLARLIRTDFDRRLLGEGTAVTPGEARTLLHAARAGEVRQNVLAERMGLEPMTLSTYVDRLEERGFVQRVPDASDRRAKLVRLTPAAEEALAAITRITSQARLRAREGLSDEEWSMLNRLLKKVRSNFQGGGF
ncbi:MarR family winged helix-turn-helix transcriptional regulator [Chelativorans sp. AA-79]|uniref:MarR family winged helix-turn-helix transcriptional regulator n=1 Tax=Chelativorans sp. AA-79 TaxID=3028735 RepID=UPI0023F89E84|nr:MarR family winged helix-turn-helix transcriptional regulator [Chelativorans sp. AA-79]WEX09920.1 MarR family winged helix-turn-helix transcriptional regulator [Chelativorans sp. AA-79]